MLIKNCLAALPGEEEFRKVDIRIAGETIAEIGPSLAPEADTLDASGWWALPGGIDAHVHFDDPGYTEREDFFAGTRAAAAGGITTVIDMPCTSVPPVTNKANLLRKLKVIEHKAVVDFGLYGGVSAQSFAEGFPTNMQELAGFVLGYKVYLTSGMDTFGRLNHYLLQKVLEAARDLGRPVLVHAEDFDYVSMATEVAQRMGHAPRHYYQSRPEIAEVLAVSDAVALAESVGADLHVVHIATAQAAALKGRRATGETAPHYLEFDEDDFESIGSLLKVAPVIKPAGNKAELWKHLASGVIDFVASDHAPSPEAQKRTGSIWTDYSGISGVQTILPYMVSEGYVKGRLSLRRLVEVTSEGPARRYGLFKRKGSIAQGKDADLVLIDPAQNWIVEGQTFLSKGTITPFEGMCLRGKVVATLLRGRVIYDSTTGIQAQAGYGKFLKRGAQ